MSEVLAQQIRAHVESRTPFRPTGSGTWLHGGGPFADAAHLDVRAHAQGVVAYEPGDLVATVGAGTTWQELSDITAVHGQMFAIAPYGSPHSTIGAMVATAASAPLAYGDLLMRDLVLGLTAITCTETGERIRAGGQVVKNVAGFDLVRLFTGAFGTLGVITEVSLRLHARPPHDDIVRVPLAQDLASVLPQIVANRGPVSLLIHMAPGHTPELWARISGNNSRVDALRTHVAALAMALDSALHTHGTADAPHDTPLFHSPADAIVLRLRTPRSDAVPFVTAAREALPHATLQYHVERGTLRAMIPAEHTTRVDKDLGTLYRIAAQFGAMHTISVAWDQGRTTPAPRSPLERQIKQQFDPHHCCNRWRSAPDEIPDHLTSSAA
ncbi:MAG: FAD-binding protein [Gemmatimonadaceae bacterium]|nr:FAD-binding protein [Gemmatimonadaceae bacterium]